MKYWKSREYHLEYKLQKLGYLDTERQWLSRGVRGDVYCPGLQSIFDCKSSIHAQKSISLQKEDLEKIERNAVTLSAMDKKEFVGGIYFSFYNGKTDYVVLTFQDFLKMRQAYIQLSELKKASSELPCEKPTVLPHL